MVCFGYKKSLIYVVPENPDQVCFLRAFLRAASGRSASKTVSVANLNAFAQMWERRRRRKEKGRLTSEGEGAAERASEIPESFGVKEIMLW